VKVEEFLFRKARLPRKVFKKAEPGEMPDAPRPRTGTASFYVGVAVFDFLPHVT
jgi:hypothetical protein